jgi:hypothetical protein
MIPRLGWIWHLAEQVAGRSPGQFPHASLHDYVNFRRIYDGSTDMSISLLSTKGYHIILTDTVKSSNDLGAGENIKKAASVSPN